MNLFRNNKLIFFERETNGRQFYVSDKQYLFHFLSFTGFKASPFFKENFINDYENRFFKGDLCAALSIYGQIVNISWLAKKYLFISEIEKKHHILKNEIMVYDVITIESERGKGYYPLMLESIIQWAMRNKYEKVSIYSETKNISSIKGIIKAGFRQKQTTTLLKIAGLKFYTHSLTADIP